MHGSDISFCGERTSIRHPIRAWRRRVDLILLIPFRATSSDKGTAELPPRYDRMCACLPSHPDHGIAPRPRPMLPSHAPYTYIRLHATNTALALPMFLLITTRHGIGAIQGDVRRYRTRYCSPVFCAHDARKSLHARLVIRLHASLPVCDLDLHFEEYA